MAMKVQFDDSQATPADKSKAVDPGENRNILRRLALQVSSVIVLFFASGFYLNYQPDPEIRSAEIAIWTAYFNFCIGLTLSGIVGAILGGFIDDLYATW